MPSVTPHSLVGGSRKNRGGGGGGGGGGGSGSGSASGSPVLGGGAVLLPSGAPSAVAVGPVAAPATTTTTTTTTASPSAASSSAAAAASTSLSKVVTNSSVRDGNGTPNGGRGGGGHNAAPGSGGGATAAGPSSSGLSSRFSRSGAFRAAQHIGSVPDDWPMYSSQPEDYVLGDVIGFGASSVVCEASFKPLNGRACAVKVIELEAYGRDTEELRRETQLMSLSKHPNVLRVRGCWVEGSKLHIATRLMSAGSMLDIMRFSYPDGFDEVVIATVLKQALEGLNYLHINGWLHRDLKAANMLVDDDGTVLLGDFGVGVFLGDAGSANTTGAAHNGKATEEEAWAEGKRKSFVGTPCWMAPEVVERKHYGTPADIWSFGITALELSSGRAPRSRLPPVKVLMKTLQEEPPELDRTGGAHKYSKAFDDFVRQCLQKDPAKRPTAEKLLHHPFFKQAQKKKYLVSAILSGLPPLSERQERRRAMSIASIRNQASWDFGSVSSRGGGGGLGTPGAPPTPLGERFDPFRNFTGTTAATTTPISPQGSVRSKIVSIDGEHAFVEAESTDVRVLSDNWRASLGASAGTGAGAAVAAAAAMGATSGSKGRSGGAAMAARARNRSTEMSLSRSSNAVVGGAGSSFGVSAGATAAAEMGSSSSSSLPRPGRHRKSVSFDVDEPHAVAAAAAAVAAAAVAAQPATTGNAASAVQNGGSGQGVDRASRSAADVARAGTSTAEGRHDGSDVAMPSRLAALVESRAEAGGEVEAERPEGPGVAPEPSTSDPRPSSLPSLETGEVGASSAMRKASDAAPPAPAKSDAASPGPPPPPPPPSSTSSSSKPAVASAAPAAPARSTSASSGHARRESLRPVPAVLGKLFSRRSS